MKKKSKFFREEKGFTLLELLTVMTIIGLMSTVILSSISNARAKGQDAALVANARQLVNAMELFLSDYGRYPYDGMNTTNCRLGPNIPGAYCIYRPITPAYDTPANTANINAIVASLGQYAARLPEILTGAGGITRTMNIFIFGPDFTPTLCLKNLEGTKAYIPQANSYIISGRLVSAAHNPSDDDAAGGIFVYTGGVVLQGPPPLTWGGVTCS